ncbi:MAG: PCMD domain-containing protein [Bacteroidaceae bacterium]|nr:PCMD domain-containing protein [Bacteroidaceae bacterium]
MAKKNIFKLLSFITLALLTSCIREEAPNAECDIIAVKTSWLEENKGILSGKPIITNTAVRFYVNEETSISDLKELDPQFELTPGAQISSLRTINENGERGIYMLYHTTSEDGNWCKVYTISFTKQSVIDTDAVFSFEHFAADKKYTVWYEEDANGTRLDWWATANAGFNMSGLGKTPEDFPTSIDTNGVKGNCVKLTTRSTGSFGKMMKMPIAPGNIFIGEFITANATKKPLEATRFGLTIAPSKPVSLTGYYKYEAGEVFTNKAMEEIADRRDTCAIYSVLYEVDPNNVVTLDGSNVLSSDRIVLVAQLENPGEESEWTAFEIPYKEVNGKVFDSEKLANGEYAITVVATSSKGGDVFEGAVGSTLHIDEFKINWDNK